MPERARMCVRYLSRPLTAGPASASTNAFLSSTFVLRKSTTKEYHTVLRSTAEYHTVPRSTAE